MIILASAPLGINKIIPRANYHQQHRGELKEAVFESLQNRRFLLHRLVLLLLSRLFLVRYTRLLLLLFCVDVVLCVSVGNDFLFAFRISA